MALVRTAHHSATHNRVTLEHPCGIPRLARLSIKTSPHFSTTAKSQHVSAALVVHRQRARAHSNVSSSSSYVPSTSAEDQTSPPAPSSPFGELDLFSGQQEQRMSVFEKQNPKLYVNGFDDYGFIVNNTYYRQPLILLPRRLFIWKIANLNQLTQASLSLVQVINPVPNIVLLGTGTFTVHLHSKLYDDLLQRNVAVDVMDSSNACSTFNFLNQEDRAVVAFLLPRVTAPGK